MKSLRLSALLVISSALTVGATDLVPRFISTMNEGVVIRRPYFADGPRKYGIRIDAETKLSEYEGGALFRFEEFPDATMRLRFSPLPAQTGFGPESLDRYQTVARSLLPAGAGEITLLDGELNPLPINGWESYRVTFAYRAANGLRRQSVIFLNLKPAEQIVVQTTANERDFTEVFARAFNIIRRWHEIEPKDDQPFS